MERLLACSGVDVVGGAEVVVGLVDVVVELTADVVVCGIVVDVVDVVVVVAEDALRGGSLAIAATAK